MHRLRWYSIKGVYAMKRCLRALPCLILLLLFVWFLAPVFAGVVSIANVLGMAVCAGLLLLWRRRKKFAAWLSRLWHKKGGRAVLTAAGCLVLALTVLFGVLTGLVLSGMHSNAGGCDTVIVLGCQVHGQTPSLLLSYRIDAACTYLEQNPQAVCVLSGGQGRDEDISEAECMYRAMCGRGIDPARLYREDASTNTFENIRNSVTLMEREGLSTDAVLVTNSFHVYRARQIARQAGLPAQAVSATTSLPMLATYILREELALIKLWLLGV